MPVIVNATGSQADSVRAVSSSACSTSTMDLMVESSRRVTDGTVYSREGTVHMGMCVRFVCQYCGDAIDSWDEGNPYYVDSAGNKQYAYHPQPEREHCIGIESPHLCLSCGIQFPVDSNSQVGVCPACSSADVVDTFRLGGRRCPSCKIGSFKLDPKFHCIS
jgi:hypothetical protein